MLDGVSDLVRTDIELAAILGEIEELEGYLVVRTPHNPSFYHGNFLHLPGPPEDIDLWCERFEDAFGPDVLHRCFTWSGAKVSDEVDARAQRLGFMPDSGVAMAMDDRPSQPRAPELDWTLRPLDPHTEFEKFEALNIACDPADITGPESYRAFKHRLRATNHAWMTAGHATWWGAFDGDRLVGQCGFAVFGDLGRFQSVEVHPEDRRRGICSSMIAAVAGNGFDNLGCRRVLLAADGMGPAIGLYRRLGFEIDGEVRSLVRAGDGVQILPETLGRQADVRGILTATFDTPAEADIVDALRGSEHAISLVAVQSGAVFGHIFFSPVEIHDGDDTWQAMALGPMAVRPSVHGRGIGTQLVKAGLEACRAAGHEVCFVLGHADYYPRFGFTPAAPLGLTSQWDVPDDVFMVAELSPGALRNRRGRVAYAPAFGSV